MRKQIDRFRKKPHGYKVLFMLCDDVDIQWKRYRVKWSREYYEISFNQDTKTVTFPESDRRIEFRPLAYKKFISPMQILKEE